MDQRSELAGMKWDIMSASSANCLGKREISQRLLKPSSWGSPVFPLASREDSQTPSNVHIADR